MKVKLLFINGPLGGGGAERVLIDLLRNLDYNKYEVDLCLLVNQGVLLSEVPVEVNIIPLWNDYTLYYKIAYRFSVWFGNHSMFRYVLKKKLSKNYDVEISFLEGIPLKLHALMNTKAKKITWVHCDLFNFPYEAKQFSKNEELAAYDKMDTIVCVSKDALNAFNKRFPNCNSNKIVLYNPIDIDKIYHLSKKENKKKNQKFTIASVGRLTDPKKIDRVIRLASRLKKEQMDVKFQIIGDGELKKELLLLCKNMKVDDIVEFVGFVKNPFPFVKNADMMLLSSGYEGFGLVVCEAMSLGVPVVSTQTTGPSEIINNNMYGLLCEHDDESIYKAVKKMINEEDLRKYYSKKGAERVKDFNINVFLSRFDTLIEKITS